jgi:LuxR family maltose regulon positive regulatory protein
VIEARDRGGSERVETPSALAYRDSRSERAHLDEILARERLTGMLAGANNELVLLAAPPGFGKTTLLHQWRAVDKRPFVWITVDSADNEPAHFWTRIFETLRHTELGFESAGHIALRASQPDLVGTVVPLLAHDLRFVDHELVLVIDDYQAIQNRVCHESIGLLLDWLPANVTLVLATRVDPPLAVGTLRARGELLELRAVDLCFTDEEEADYLNGTLGLNLGPATLATLHERTEGWPAGVYLASLSLRKTDDRAEFVAGFGGSNRHVVDYLTEVALDSLDARQREFLLGTSILDSVTAPLADAVTGETGSAELLDDLERANLFLVALDNEREWYRYHQLFAQLLRAQLMRYEPERIPELHRRAFEWYAGAQHIDEAIRHAVAAGEVERAVELALEDWRPRLSCVEGRRTLRRLDRFPDEVVAGDARLLVVMAWARSITREPEEALHALAAARDAGLEGELPDGTPLEAAAAITEASFPRGDAAGMRAAARRTLAHADAVGTAWAPLVLLSTGWAEYLAGRWDAAQSLLRQAAESATDRNQWGHVTIAKSLYALAAFAAGEREVAEAFVGGSREAMEEHGVTDTFALGLADLAHGVLLAGTSPRKAEQRLNRALDRLRIQGEPLLVADALIALAPVRRRLRGPKAGRECIAEARELLDGCASPGMLAERLERVARTLTPAYRRADGASDLTERELEVLRYLAAGMPKREIAATLFLSYNTIHSHTKSIYQKLRVSSREDAVTKARALGVL